MINTGNKKNILFIMVDQVRADILSFYGGRLCQTPNLAEIAEKGVVFEHAYTTCPMCSPARASIQTGKWPHSTGVITNIYNYGCMTNELRDSPELLSRRLQDNGYRAGYFGKWHLGTSGGTLPVNVGYEGDNFPGHGGGGHGYPEYRRYLRKKGIDFELRYGGRNIDSEVNFDEVSSSEESTVEHFLVDRLLGKLGDWEKQEPRPFYVSLNFWGPHEPYYPTTRFLDMYRDMPVEPWLSYNTAEKNKPGIHDVKRLQAGVENWHVFEELIRHHLGFMSLIDYQIGRVLNYVRENNLEKDTVIIFCADHGDSLGMHGGMYDKGFSMYEETCRVPLLVYDPDAGVSGARERRLVSLNDLYPTVLEYAGSGGEETGNDCKSLVPLVHGRACPWRDCVAAEGAGIQGTLYTQRMIRDSRHKYVYNAGGIDELYDLGKDPAETCNLVHRREYKAIKDELRGKLYGWMEETKDPCRKHFMILTNG